MGAVAGGGILGGLAANEQNAQQEKQRRNALMLEAAGTRDSWARQNGQGNVVKAEPWKFGTEGGGLMSGVVGGVMSGLNADKGQKSLIEQIKGFSKPAVATATTPAPADRMPAALDPFEQAFQDYQPEDKPSLFQNAKRGYSRINYGL
jgi:hypothetical protein